MYVPTAHEETDLTVLHQLIAAHPLGLWATLAGGEDRGELIANPVPFLIDPTRGEFGTLMAHVARANPVWQTFSKRVPSLVVFQGPQTYITPSWYPSKHAHGKAVPTWNYVVVQAHGQPQAIEDRDWLLAHITQLTHTHEAGQRLPWLVSDAPADFTERLLGMVVGIEIPITKIIGKWKVSQNRPEGDKLGVVAGLTSRDDDNSRAMAALVKRHVASS